MTTPKEMAIEKIINNVTRNQKNNPAISLMDAIRMEGAITAVGEATWQEAVARLKA